MSHVYIQIGYICGRRQSDRISTVASNVDPWFHNINLGIVYNYKGQFFFINEFVTC